MYVYSFCFLIYEFSVSERWLVVYGDKIDFESLFECSLFDGLECILFLLVYFVCN